VKNRKKSSLFIYITFLRLSVYYFSSTISSQISTHMHMTAAYLVKTLKVSHIGKLVAKC